MLGASNKRPLSLSDVFETVMATKNLMEGSVCRRALEYIRATGVCARPSSRKRWAASGLSVFEWSSRGAVNAVELSLAMCAVRIVIWLTGGGLSVLSWLFTCVQDGDDASQT